MGRTALLVISLLLPLVISTGCIEHSVRVLPPHDVLPAHLIVGTRAVPADKPYGLSKPMPVELFLSAWEHPPAGSSVARQGFSRVEMVARSPLSWWQRFPCDIVSDLLPIHCRALTEITLAYRPVTPQDRTKLTHDAHIHGYAHIPVAR